jgi:2-isopropylmalate synthase
VFLDAEHFFDGYRADREFSLGVIEAAQQAGAEALVLCDTNGGTLPHEVERVVAEVAARTGAKLGVHFHNDGGCAVANSLVAVRAGASQVQGCINGYGERVGNADLSAVVPNLALKMDVATIPADRLERLTAASHHIAELVNITPDPQQPYVGASAFAHKAGLHVSAIARRSDAYEHVAPDSVGNGTRFVVSELAGRSTLAIKAAELGLHLDDVALGDVLDTLKRLEHQGYHFEAADGSLELLMRQATGWEQTFFEVESFRVITEHRADQSGGRGGAGAATPGTAQGVELGPSSFEGLTTEATVKVHVAGERIVAAAEGNGPVHALDAALRKAIGPRLPGLSQLHLTDYRVRVLDTAHATGAVTRVLIDSTDGERSWSTIGVSENIIEASWQALVDSIVYGLLHNAGPGSQPRETE